MTRLEMMILASKAYHITPDPGANEWLHEGLAGWFSLADGWPLIKPDGGDGLAQFICIELSDTYDPEASDLAQRVEATRVMMIAQMELLNIVQAFAAVDPPPPTPIALNQS